MSKINLEVAESLDFEEGDCCITIKKDGSIGKVIVPKMNREMLDSDGYKALLDVVEVLQPGAILILLALLLNYMQGTI